MLHLRNVTYREDARTVIDAVDLDIEPGTVTVLLGPPDAGTSTLLRLIGGEIAPSDGTIACDEGHGAVRLSLNAGLAYGGGEHIELAAPYVVLDDPAAPHLATAGLRGRDAACRLVRACARFASRGAGVIAALRDVDLAAAFADRIVLMHHGQIVADGAPQIVLDPSFVRSVFGHGAPRPRPA